MALNWFLAPVAHRVGAPAQAARRRVGHRFRPGCEALEDRCTPAILTVTQASDVVNGNLASPAALIANNGGDGISLREAIQAANNDSADDTINFTAALRGVPLPITFAAGGSLNISTNVVINGIDPTDNTVTVLQGPGGGPNAFPIFNLSGTVAIIVITDLTVTGGHNPGGMGGGITVIDSAIPTFINLLISNNGALLGGGIGSRGATTNLRNSTVTNNRIISDGGAGAGIYNETTFIIQGSTIDTNSYTAAGVTAGGGIFNMGDLFIANSTIANNSANVSGGFGGAGIYNQQRPADGSGGRLTINHATIVGNVDFSGQGGGIRRVNGTLNLANSIVADNTATGNALNNNFSSGAHNGTGGGTNFFGTGAGLTPLQNNGGLTRTMAPASSGSPVLNMAAPPFVVDPVFGFPLPTDQRAVTRIVGAAADFGAVEFQPPATTTVVSVALGTVTAQGQVATLTATVAAQSPGPNNVPTGNLTFSIDGVPQLPSALVNGAFTATVLLPAGPHTVTVVYAGDVLFNASTSGVRTITAAFLVNTTLTTKKGRRQLTIINANTLAPIVQLFPFAASFRGKAALLRLDTNNDGAQEVLVIQTSGRGNKGQVNVYDSQTGALLKAIKPFKGAISGSVKATSLDLNGDNRLDLQLIATVRGKKVTVKLNGNGLGVLT